MKNIILFGIQGSGKGTQAQKIVDHYPGYYSYFSTGMMFRSISTIDNSLGSFIKASMEQGKLIPDEITNAFFSAFLHATAQENKSLILDGYPRNIEQADLVLSLLKETKRDALGLVLDLSDETAKERMKLRAREDDTEEAIAVRIQQYYEKTVPVIDHMSQHIPLVNINAEREINTIYDDIAQQLL